VFSLSVTSSISTTVSKSNVSRGDRFHTPIPSLITQTFKFTISFSFFVWLFDSKSGPHNHPPRRESNLEVIQQASKNGNPAYSQVVKPESYSPRPNKVSIKSLGWYVSDLPHFSATIIYRTTCLLDLPDSHRRHHVDIRQDSACHPHDQSRIFQLRDAIYVLHDECRF